MSFGVQKSAKIIKWQGYMESPVEILTTSGAINPLAPVSVLDTTAGALTMTMALPVYPIIKEIMLRQPVQSANITIGGSVYILNPERPSLTISIGAGTNQDQKLSWQIIFGHSYYLSAQQQKLSATDIIAGAALGYRVAISADGSTMAAGAPLIATNTGAVYVFTRTGTTWTQQAKLVASDAQVQDYFGAGLDISADGNTIIAGAYGEDAGGALAGAAYVFTRSSSTWTQQQKLTGAAAGDYFGYDVGLNADGNTAIIGAYFADGAGSDRGAAHVYTRTGTTWTQQQVLTASDAADDDYFGYSVCLNGNGNIAAIGANNATAGVGAAYIFTRLGTTWTEEEILNPSDAPAGASFGDSVSLNADGTVVAVGASDIAGGGAVYVYNRDDGSSATTPNLFIWTERQIVVSNDIAAGDKFGFTCALSADGKALLVGAYSEGSTEGAIYSFNNVGNWVQQSKLVSSDLEASDWFGCSVDISANGNTCVAGAQYEDGGTGDPYSNAGAAYIFI